jgi:Flp pilus assembly protein TadD
VPPSPGERLLRRSVWTWAPAVAALLVYASIFGAGYVYDDNALIVTNRWVHDADVLWQLPFKPLLASSGVGSTDYYRPIVNVFYNLTWHSLGGRPLAFHVLNVLVHMLNATLLLKLVRRLRGTQDIVAVGAATVFAVHPLCTEVVAWASGLPELGYVAFGLSTLLLHVRAWSATEDRARWLRLAAFVLFGCACACKETALAIVPLIVLLELWLRPANRAQTGSDVVDAVHRVVPYLVSAAIYFAIRTAVLGGLMPPDAHGLRTPLDSVWNAPGLLLHYVGMMIVPSPLLIEHVVTLVKTPANPSFIAGAVIIAAGAVAVMRLRRLRPDLAFAACLAVLPLVPALYLPALGRNLFAERYAYLGVAGFCWLLIGGAEALASRPAIRIPAWGLPVFVYAVSIAAASLTVRRCGDWYDDGTLGMASMRDEPRAPVGYLLAGDWLKREGRTEEAWRVYRDGLDHVPANVELQQKAVGMGVELHHMTREDVLAEYERLVPLSRDSAPALFNLGHALLEGGRLDAAQAAFTRALELVPNSAPTMTGLAEVALRRGDAPTAAALCRRALAVNGRWAAASQLLGVALMQTGDFPGAIAPLERAVLLEPANTSALNQLGEAYLKTERVDDARRTWERALVNDPNFAAVRRNLEMLGPRESTR